MLIYSYNIDHSVQFKPNSKGVLLNRLVTYLPVTIDCSDANPGPKWLNIFQINALNHTIIMK